MGRDHVTLPPPDPLPTTLEIVEWREKTEFVRIYNPNAFGQTELTFRHHGPLSRFDHHRAPPEAPEEDLERAIWYGAPIEQPTIEAFEICAWECFASKLRVDPSYRLGRVQVASGEKLVLLSLIDGAANQAGTVAQIAATPNAEDSQAWSRFFYETDSVYGTLDGLVYRSAWTGGLCVALYERAAPAMAVRSGLSSLPLRHPWLEERLAELAKQYGWTIAVAGLPK